MSQSANATGLALDYCPQCGRTGDDLGECGSKIMPCPEPKPVTEATVIIQCGPCGKTRVVPAAAIMRGKVGSFGGCDRDLCMATVLSAPTADVPPAPSLDAEVPAPAAPKGRKTRAE